MAEEMQEFTHESLQDRESILRYLEALGEGFEQGKLKLTSGGQDFVLEAPALVKLDVRAKQKRSRVEVVVKISWKHRKHHEEFKVEALNGVRAGSSKEDSGQSA
jgi:amphi-Trp domain-containing protein